MENQPAKLRLNYKIWFETPDKKGILGDGKCALLKAIDETGSLNAAMLKLGWTYRKTWNNLRKIEKELGFQVIRTVRGGAEGGSTTLTPQGRFIMAAFEKFHAECDAYINAAFNRILSEFPIEARQ